MGMTVLLPRFLTLIFFSVLFHTNLSRSTLLRGGRPDDERNNSTIFLPLHRHAGSFHVNVWLGEPPQHQLWIIDTGSRLTATTCEPCKDCGNSKAAPYWRVQDSSTVANMTSCHPECPTYSCLNNSDATINDKTFPRRQTIEKPCQVQQRYTEGSSWTAQQVQDLIVLGGSENAQDLIQNESFGRLLVAFSFGCQHKLSGLFKSQYANGILGLQPSPLSLIARLANDNVIPRQAFGLCLTRSDGFLTLPMGTIANETSLLNYSPLQSESKYMVKVRQVCLNDICLLNQTFSVRADASFETEKGTIIDSGTTDTYFPAAIHKIWSRAFQAITNLTWQPLHNSQYTYKQFQTFPTVSINLENNASFVMKPEDYVEGLPTKQAYWTGVRSLSIRIFTNEPQGAVLGMNALQHQWVELDITNQRVGVSPRLDCHELSQRYATS